MGSGFQPRLRNSITCHDKTVGHSLHQFDKDVSVATHVSIRDLQQLQSQNNVQAGVLAKIGQQNLKKYEMIAKPSRHLGSIKCQWQKACHCTTCSRLRAEGLVLSRCPPTFTKPLHREPSWREEQCFKENPRVQVQMDRVLSSYLFECWWRKRRSWQ